MQVKPEMTDLRHANYKKLLTKRSQKTEITNRFNFNKLFLKIIV